MELVKRKTLIYLSMLITSKEDGNNNNDNRFVTIHVYVSLRVPPSISILKGILGTRNFGNFYCILSRKKGKCAVD